MTPRHKLRLIPALLLLLILLPGCGALDGVYDLSTGDPLAIREFIVNNSVGEVKRVVEGGKERYMIFITLPQDTDFKQCVANITLPPGASISGDSPCLINDLAGRPVLNLILEQRGLIVNNNGETREYDFGISLSEE